MREPLDEATLRKALLAPGMPWRGVECDPDMDSTNARALRLAEPWRVVVADHQSAGRGRMRRSWQAPPRASVAVSVLLPWPPRPTGRAWVPLLAGLAIARAIEDNTALGTGLKWPNDVLLEADGWRKVSGVLCEAAPGEGGVVVGAGVNVDQTRDELPVDTATSLRLAGAAADRTDLLLAYLARLQQAHRALALGGPDADGEHTAYRQQSVTIGRQVRLSRAGGADVLGRATDVDEQGRLVVESGGGRSVWTAGDVEHLRNTAGARSGLA